MNWKFWTWLSPSNDTPVVDHLPISGNKDYRRLRKKAKRRHGKTFRADVIHAYETLSRCYFGRGSRTHSRQRPQRAVKVRKLGVK